MPHQQIQHGGVPGNDQPLRVSSLLPEMRHSLLQHPPGRLLHLQPEQRVFRRLNPGNHIRSKHSLRVGAYILSPFLSPAVIPFHRNSGGSQIGYGQFPPGLLQSVLLRASASFSQGVPFGFSPLRQEKGSRNHLHLLLPLSSGRTPSAAGADLASISPLCHRMLLLYPFR